MSVISRLVHTCIVATMALAAVGELNSAAAQDVPPVRAEPCNLPPIYLEDGFNVGEWGMGTDDIWAIPNVFPMIRADPRVVWNADGTWYWAYSYQTPGTRTPAEFAQDVANRVQWFFQTTSTFWSNTRPRQWAMIFVGFDAPDCSTHIFRHPDDAVPGFAGLPIGSPWTSHVRADTTPWCTAAFEALRVELIARQLPAPSRLFTDFEAIGDSVGWSFNPQGTGMFQVVQGDPRYNTELIDGVNTLQQWFAARTTTLGGGPIPAYNPTYGVYDPNNFEPTYALCSEAMATAYMYAMSEAVYAPFKAAFPNRPCGEWANHTNSRTSPSLVRPQQFRYQLNGYRAGIDMMIPVNYCAPETFRVDTDPVCMYYADPRWECQDNWEAAYPVSGGTPNARLFELGRVVGEIRVAQIKNAAPTSQVVPSVSIHFAAHADHPFAISSMSRFIKNTYHNGASAYWLWEPSYHSDPVKRDAIKAYIRAANALICPPVLSELPLN